MISGQVSVSQSCYVVYVPETNAMYLLNDAGNSMLGPTTIGNTGSLSNSQCTLAASGSAAVVSGNTLALNVSLTFSSSFAGTPNIYLYAQSASGQSTGFIARGTWTGVPESPFFPQANPTTAGVIVTAPGSPVTSADISATDDSSLWVVDIGNCASAPCLTIVQDPVVGPSLLATFNTLYNPPQGDISTGSLHPNSSGLWDLSQKNTISFYFKDNNTAFADPAHNNTSALYHYVLLYDKSSCLRQWFLSGDDIPVGEWVQISVPNFQTAPFYYQSCQLDFSKIAYFEVGVWGPNLSFGSTISFQVAHVGTN